MGIKKYVLAAALIIGGLFLVLRGIIGADWLGTTWLTSKANDQWWLTPYIGVTAANAYNYFAKLPMILGGVCTGLAIVLIFKRHARLTVLAMLAAISLTAIAFNTFDYMDAAAAGGLGPQKFFPIWNFNLGIIIDGWDFYFFFVIVPLFVGGMLMSLPTYLAVKSGRCQG